MTIQFRSRIRSVFDYGKDLKKIGKCCFTNDTSEQLTFLECFRAGGQFYTDPNASCPLASDLGNCCACAYTSQSFRASLALAGTYTGNPTQQPFFSSDGVLSNITKCECDRVGGVWTPANSLPNYYNICRKNIVYNGQNFVTDARIPNACCYLQLENGSPTGVICENVCTQRECANKVIAESGPADPFVDSVYNENQQCTSSFITGIPPVTCSTNPITNRMLTSTLAFSDNNHGPCYSLTNVNGEYSYNCSLTPEFQCNDYWIDPTLTGNEVEYCNHKYKPKTPTKTSDYLNPIIYSKNEFNNLNLIPGQEFQGGIYIGVFEPLKPRTSSSSIVYGSLNFSEPQSITIPVSDESSYTKWAIIVNKTYINTNLIYADDINISTTSSYYDGYANCYGEPGKLGAINSKTISSITGVIRNGFADYYIPSIIEMMFFAKQILGNEKISTLFDINKIFTSTTFFTDKYSTQQPTGKNTFDGNSFLYSTSFQTGQNFGKSTLVGINSKVNLMLFRRLIIS